MGIFSRTVDDNHWRTAIEPVFDSARNISQGFFEGIETDDFASTVHAAHLIEATLPACRQALRQAGKPSSRLLQKLSRQFDIAMKDYLDAGSQALSLARHLQTGLLERLQAQGKTGRAAAARIAFQKTLYEEIAKKAEARMREVEAGLRVLSDQ